MKKIWIAIVLVLALVGPGWGATVYEYLPTGSATGPYYVPSWNAQFGQSFKVSDNCTLTSITVRVANPYGDSTGNVYLVIYEGTGTWDGTNGNSSITPTGSILATSDNVNITTLGTTTSPTATNDTNFTFSGANQISLSTATVYVVFIKFNSTNGDVVTSYYTSVGSSSLGNTIEGTSALSGDMPHGIYGDLEAPREVAGTFYISSTGSGDKDGSDVSNAMGPTEFNAFTFIPDDIILLSDDDGIFSSCLTLSQSGTSGHPIIIKNVAGDNVIFNVNTSISNSGWTDDGDGKYHIESSPYLSGFLEDGLPLPKATNSDLTDGNFYIENNNSPLYYKPTSGTPSSHTLIGLKDWTTLGLLSDNTCINVTGQSYISIEKNTTGSIKLAKTDVGIGSVSTSTGNSNIIINGITFEYCFDSTIFYYTTGEVTSSGEFKNNSSYRCQSMFRNYNQYGTIDWDIYNNTGTDVGSTDGSTAWNCGNDHEFIGVQNINNSSIYNNTMTGGHARFIFLYAASNTVNNNLVYNNYCYDNKDAIFYIAGDIDVGEAGSAQFNGNKIYNNIIYIPSYVESPSPALAGLFVWPVDNSTVHTNYYYNNTVIGAPYGWAIYTAWTGSGATKAGWVIKNNIFSNIGEYEAWAQAIWSTMSGYTADYNCYNNASKGFYYGGEADNWATWKSNIGNQEANSIYNSDPLFIDSTPGEAADVKLQSGSPAAKAGTDVGLATDYAGNPWKNPPSMGAYQYFTALEQLLWRRKK